MAEGGVCDAEAGKTYDQAHLPTAFGGGNINLD